MFCSTQSDHHCSHLFIIRPVAVVADADAAAGVGGVGVGGGGGGGGGDDGHVSGGTLS